MADSELALFYRKIFASYPFPVFVAEYLSRMMTDNVRYYSIHYDHTIIAAAVIEANLVEKYGEMTDFATLPYSRGKELAVCLLSHTD